MKKFIISICFVFTGLISYQQQWTGSGTTGYLWRAGNVGIGTSIGSAPLSVYQATALGLPLNSYSIIRQLGGLTGPNVGNSNRFYNSIWLRKVLDGDNTWYGTLLHDGISIDGSYNIPGSTTRTWWERNPSVNTQSWGDLGNTYMTLNAGNLGIGTTVPSQKLEVNGTTLSNVVWIGSGINSTNSSGYLLAVNGSAIFNKVVVKLYPWADYVFEKNYKLQSLDSLKTYINQNKHLPGIPSTDEMKKKDGVDVGDMQTKLLQKVEELTLYILDLQKQIDELKKEKK